MLRLVFGVVLLAALCAAQAPAGCDGTMNKLPLFTGNPTFINRTRNGIRYFVKSNDTTHGQGIHIVHVYGTPYEMGKAYGELMRAEVKEMLSVYWTYLEHMVEEFIKVLPEIARKWIADLGLKGALDLTYSITEKWTPARFTEEMKGIADGAGVEWEWVRRLNLLPELTQAHCTIIGTWGDATKDRNCLQLRALDWDTNAPISKFPSVTVYHPSEAGSNSFANIGYVGLIGAITGYSNASVGVSEKVWISPKESEISSRFGKPWLYVLRDVLQYAGDTDTALSMFASAERTAAIFIGVGDSKSQEFRGVEYSHKILNFVDWTSSGQEWQGHPRIKDTVYWDKHVQPSHNQCLGNVLQQNFGKIDAETIFRQATAYHRTGSNQVAVYDYGRNLVYLSYNSPTIEPKNAFDRQFVLLNMTQLFTLQQ